GKSHMKYPGEIRRNITKDHGVEKPVTVGRRKSGVASLTDRHKQERMFDQSGRNNKDA
ncbi:unnamed protein product, partial [Ilex paraguariensis]